MQNQQTTRLMIALLGVSILALTACSSSQVTKKQLVYQCERGSVLDVTIVERVYPTSLKGRHSKMRHLTHATAAIVNINGEQIVTLPMAEIASGFKYSNGRYTLHGKGNEAIWTVGKMVDEQCVAD
ncbi:MAG: MliC family protein [Methylophilaceae bacterium]